LRSNGSLEAFGKGKALLGSVALDYLLSIILLILTDESDLRCYVTSGVIKSQSHFLHVAHRHSVH
jgi:hypothetical protein